MSAVTENNKGILAVFNAASLAQKFLRRAEDKHWLRIGMLALGLSKNRRSKVCTSDFNTM